MKKRKRKIREPQMQVVNGQVVSHSNLIPVICGTNGETVLIPADKRFKYPRIQFPEQKNDPDVQQ